MKATTMRLWTGWLSGSSRQKNNTACAQGLNQQTAAHSLTAVRFLSSSATSPVSSRLPACVFLPLMSKYTLNVNGQSRSIDAAPDTPLLWVLRDNLNLVGTKFGCGIGQCGACTVHLNGVPTRACLTPVSTVGRMIVTTIEGLDPKASH